MPSPEFPTGGMIQGNQGYGIYLLGSFSNLGLVTSKQNILLGKHL